jgi:hypothetical protein
MQKEAVAVDCVGSDAKTQRVETKDYGQQTDPKKKETKRKGK